MLASVWTLSPAKASGHQQNQPDSEHDKQSSDWDKWHIDPNPFFDVDYYLGRHGDEVNRSGLYPLRHYLVFGYQKGFQPNPIFDSIFAQNQLLGLQAKYQVDVDEVFLELFVGKQNHDSEHWGRPKGHTQAPGLSHTAIVIPVFNNWIWTERCLRAIELCEEWSKLTVFIVDDASSDDTATFVKSKYPWVRLIKNEKNIGFLQSCNKAFALIRKEFEFVLVLNNDTEPQSGFVVELLSAMDGNPELAVCGSRLAYPDGTLQEAGGVIWNDGSGWNFGRGNPVALEQLSRRRVDYVSGASVLIRVSKINGELFDVRYEPAYYEDTDLAFGQWRSGAEVEYVPYSIVVHHEGKSHGTNTSDPGKKFQDINRRKFAEKWALELKKQPRFDPSLVTRAAFRRQFTDEAKVILWIDYQLPDPTRDSGSMRAVQMATILLGLGFTIVFAPQNGDVSKISPYWLSRHGVVIQKSLAHARSFLRAVGAEPSFLVLSRETVARQYMSKVKAAFPRALVIFDTVDLHFLRIQRLAENANSNTLRHLAQETQKSEVSLANQANVTLVVSKFEETLLRKLAPHSRIEVVSNIHDLNSLHSGTQKRQGLVFVGSFNHTPNQEGVRWFLDRVWPLLKDDVKAEKFRIVGQNPPVWLREIDDPNVEVLGWVESSSEIVSRSKVSIAPLLSGAGVKGKVGEAMACGTPVIGTSVAMEGVGAAHGVSCMQADSAEDFATCIQNLFDSLKLRESVAKKALQVFESRLSRRVAEDALAKVFVGEPSDF